jgi:CRP-like cAMP-binding protein
MTIEDSWPQFRNGCATSRVPRGTLLVVQGHVPHTVVLLQTGAVKLSRAEPTGNEVIVGWRFPGSLLGSAAVLGSYPSPVSIEVLWPSEVLYIERTAFLRAMDENRELASLIFRAHARELSEQIAISAMLASATARERLLGALAYLLEAQRPELAHDPTVRVLLPGTLSDLAKVISVRPETLSRLLAQLETAGVVLRRQGWIVVPDAVGFMRKYGTGQVA